MAAETKREGTMSDMNQEKSTTQTLAQKAKETAGTVTEKAKGAAAVAGRAASQAVDSATCSAGSGLQSAAEGVRGYGPQEGMMGRATSAVAGALDSSGRYLSEEGMSGIAEDLTGMIRRYPVASMLVGVGVGFLLAQMTTRSTNHG